MMFPDCFYTGELPEDQRKEILIATGLEGWACCSLKQAPIPTFGMAMAKIAAKLNILGTPESFMKLAKELES